MNALIFNRLVKLRLTLFGLPITLAGALLPFAAKVPVQTGGWVRWVLIVVAFVSARTAGMAFNELIDRKIDAENPRTRDRVLPKEQAKPFEVALLAWTFLALFIVACWRINRAAFLLAPGAAFLVASYAYTKRFTALCHFILGLIHFLNPIMAWAAITGSVSPAPLLLGAAALCSIAAQDILYALQDHAFDSAHGVYSVPVSVGLPASIWLGRALHGLALILLVATGYAAALNPIYYVGVALLALVILRRYVTIRSAEELSSALMASNSYFAVLTFLSVFLALIVGLA